jgi:membrane protease subunit (stomatin/prohibitin family)
MVSLRAHGAYTIRISDPAVFLNKIVGTKGLEYTNSLEDFLRTIIISNLNQVLGAKAKSILDLPVLYTEIQEMVKDETCGTFKEYGIELVDPFVEAITPPPEVMEMINKATGIEAQNPEKYKNIAIADATLEAAKNPNGGMGAFMGAGLGMGTGLSMGQTIASQVSPMPGNQAIANPVNTAPKMSAAELKEKLAALKDLADQGIITNNDFEEQKKKLLSML